MIAYVIRRLLYIIPILMGVNFLLFSLFFTAYSPDDIVMEQFPKGLSLEQRESWKRQHEYHYAYLSTIVDEKGKEKTVSVPAIFINWDKTGTEKFTETIFWSKGVRLFFFDFGVSDQRGKLIWMEIKNRISPSICITIPIFLASLMIAIFFAMGVSFYRGTYIDTTVLIICVVTMSIAALFYIVVGQYLFARLLNLVPVSGWGSNILTSWQFLILPIIIGICQNIGGSTRYYRTIFLEEIGKDYIRTARAKGLGEGKVLFKHALKNAMLPILTNTVLTIPFLIVGNMLIEKFFGIPGLGDFIITAIQKKDFAVVLAMAYLGSVLFVGALIVLDIAYTFVDPRIRLK